MKMPLGRSEFHAFIHVDPVLGAGVADVGVEVVSCVTVDGLDSCAFSGTLSVVVVVGGSLVTSLVVVVDTAGAIGCC